MGGKIVPFAKPGTAERLPERPGHDKPLQEPRCLPPSLRWDSVAQAGGSAGSVRIDGKRQHGRPSSRITNPALWLA